VLQIIDPLFDSIGFIDPLKQLFMKLFDNVMPLELG